MLASFSSTAHSQNWQIVWADEFNAGIGPDWSFETGGGGWGNNELQYYRPQNATIQNGALVITAKNESIDGHNYTSARLKTQGRKSWRYGKMEARIALPAFQGSWPAFWMLGDNIGSVGWPQCGELDIMEQVNTPNTVYGATHWWSGGQADFTGSTGTSVTGYHTYSVTWDSQNIRWYVDGVQFNQFSIANNTGGTNAFNENNFFILLNLAVGGNWPGFSINNGALPANMLVDYVRVYQDVPAGSIRGTHRIVNAQSGKAMDAGSTTIGVSVVQWGINNVNDGMQQKWIFSQNSDTSWNVINQNSSYSLEMQSASDGAQVKQWTQNGGSNQRWWVDRQSDGSYKIWNQWSGKALENASSAQDGTPIIQWAWSGGNWQRWNLQ
jgi:beta-glucanase (GH16 family)